jgi:hypothetical protein
MTPSTVMIGIGASGLPVIVDDFDDPVFFLAPPNFLSGTDLLALLFDCLLVGSEEY